MEIDASLVFVSAALITGISVALANDLNRLKDVLRKMAGKDQSPSVAPPQKIRSAVLTFRLLYAAFLGFSVASLVLFVALLVLGWESPRGCMNDTIVNCSFDLSTAALLLAMPILIVSWLLALVVALRSYDFRSPAGNH